MAASKRTPAASALAASAMVARAAAWPSYEPSVWQQCCWHAGSSGRSSGSSSRPQGGVRRGSMERPKCWKYRELQVAVHGLFFCEISVSPPPNRQKFSACRRNFEGPVGGDAGPQPKIGYPGRHHHPRQSHRRSRRPGSSWSSRPAWFERGGAVTVRARTGDEMESAKTCSMQESK